MAKNIDAIAELLGASRVVSIPEAGGGAFGAARLAHIFASLQAKSDRNLNPQIPMTEATYQKLVSLAEKASSPEQNVSPIQVASRLLEEVLDSYGKD